MRKSLTMGLCLLLVSIFGTALIAGNRSEHVDEYQRQLEAQRKEEAKELRRKEVREKKKAMKKAKKEREREVNQEQEWRRKSYDRP